MLLVKLIQIRSFKETHQARPFEKKRDIWLGEKSDEAQKVCHGGGTSYRQFIQILISAHKKKSI